MNLIMDARVLSFWSRVKRQGAYKIPPLPRAESQEDPKVSQEMGPRAAVWLILDVSSALSAGPRSMRL